MCGQHLCSILELCNNLSLCVSSVIVIMFANFTGAATVGQIFSSLITMEANLMNWYLYSVFLALSYFMPHSSIHTHIHKSAFS